MNFGFTIIICTYNGRDRLSETLRHIQELIIPDGHKVELIVVDNRSTDATGDFVKDFFENYTGAVKIFIHSETKPGKAYALETALNFVQYSYVLICDDDNWLDSNYLIFAKKVFDLFPDVGVIGGKSIAVFESDPPFWFSSVSDAFIIGDQALNDGYFDQNKDFVWGAGMVFRMEIWEQLRLIHFSFTTGKNVSKAVGEDTELSMIFKLLGYRFYFSKKMVFKHFMPKERLTWSTAINYYKGFGSTGPYFTFYKKLIREKKRMTYLDIEIEILKRFILVSYQVFKLYMLKSSKEGDIYYLKYIDKCYYLIELLKVFSFRIKVIRINRFMNNFLTK